MAKTNPGPTAKTLYHGLGCKAYGSTSKSNLRKIDVIGRTILGSRQSTPSEILYAETDTEPLQSRTSWLTRKYLARLSYKPRNWMHGPAKQLLSATYEWKPRSTPGIVSEARHLKNMGITLFPPQPEVPSEYKPPPPSRPPRGRTPWFPLSKKMASTCRAKTITTFTRPQPVNTGIHNKGLHGWLQIDGHGPNDNGLLRLLPVFESRKSLDTNRRHQCLLCRANRNRPSAKTYLQPRRSPPPPK
ncbi:hypothetical protein OUZ56_033553 [Daphnia magna]|uniref:Uncharacterized protein n=1 Tax=Daphnia magna TaxID=35525 RepID=A0ABR0BAU2_9CRUS|nr:hypothetical protein OUZ56_033553 [Daphnia magna]